MKKVIVFGAGFVAPPLVHYLLEQGYAVTVVDIDETKAKRLVAGKPNGNTAPCDIEKDASIQALIQHADAVVSLLPASKHPFVARACVTKRKHLVTSSYISPAMRSLDGEAKKNDVLLLNEVGVDPGIDHISAMNLIHREQRNGGTLTGFTSWCGGLPAPEANNNPFGYKFSWSPRGVLTAAKNSARYLAKGSVVELPADQLFANPAKVSIEGLGAFEGYPNRDSISYINTYSFDRQVTGMFRGTLRNTGHCALYSQLIRLGLFDEETRYLCAGMTYRGLLEKIYGVPVNKTIADRVDPAMAKTIMQTLEFVGLFSDEQIPRQETVLLDVLADRMMATMQYAPGERDMLIMRHDFDFFYNQGKRKELVTACLVDYGIPNGYSAMARTVGYPAGIATRLILEGKISQRGVAIPITREIYIPVLDELESMGIRFTEKRKAG
jgi:saccharopine dehydrogenase-like NADP-dependent oxidoreductase